MPNSNSCANQKAGLLTKQYLGGEWSHPFCSRPRVRSSKGLKPVVIEDRKGYYPEDQCFFSIPPRQTAPPI